MKKNILFLAIAAFGLVLTAHAAGITGTITFKGTAPAEREITPIKNDPNCAALYPGALPMTRFYAVGKDGEMADVVVTLKDAAGKEIAGKSTGASAAPAVLDQKGALYVPQIIAIQTGQKLIVKNSDPFIHNVHTSPKDNPAANLVQMAGGADLNFTFDKPEPFLKFQCDVHPWMFA
jgi:plastocyanin